MNLGHGPTDPYRWRRLVRRGSNPKQLTIDWNPAAPEILPCLPVHEAPVEPKVAQVKSRAAGRYGGRLPVPRPLADAVAAGCFGTDERGRPIRPEADEVRAITEALADQLIDMLCATKLRLGKPAFRDSLPEAFGMLIAAYRQDFGERAAQQLEAYAHRQASLDESDRGDQGWRR